MNQTISEKLNLGGFKFLATCFGPDEGDRNDYLDAMLDAQMERSKGNLPFAHAIEKEANLLVKQQWQEEFHNTVMNGGRNDALTQYFTASGYTAAWYMLLVGSGTIAAADTLASHSGWSEITAYTGNRKAITFGSVSGQSITATGVAFSMNANYTVAGAGLSSVATGTSGILFDAANLSTNRSGGSGDTLTITPTITD